jgi:hypothetical protein
MSAIQMPSTPAVGRVTSLLESTIQKFLDARTTIPSMGRFESDDEAHLLIGLLIRHVEGVISLARHDLVLLPPAMAVARAAFETSVRVLWMLDPEDPFERQVRWLVGLEEYERYYDNLAKEYDKLGVESADTRGLHRLIQDFRLNVQQVLPSEYKLLPGLPNYRQILDAIGHVNGYAWYIVASNHTHPTQVATSLYRRDFGASKEFGEFIQASDWYPVMLLCAFALHTTGAKFIERCGGNSAAFVTGRDLEEMSWALASLSTGK